MMSKYNTGMFKEVSRKKKIVFIAAIALALAAIVFAFGKTGEETITYEKRDVEAVVMEQSITAAGEIEAGETETVDFSSSKTFLAMCVEEGDKVSKGQHLISYSDGTYEDAPEAGIVSTVEAPATGDTGDDENYVILSYTDTLDLVISVPEDEINKISKGDTALVVVNANQDEQYEGTIVSVTAMSEDLMSETDNSEDEKEGEMGKAEEQSASETSSNNYSVTIELENDGTVKPGMSAGCTVTVSSRKDVLAVPIEAVYFDGSQAYVNLISSDGVVKTNIETGQSDANYVEITDGLQKGDTVQIEVRGQ